MRTALITGASRGIGLGIAQSLAGSFEHLILQARDLEKLKSLKFPVATSLYACDFDDLAATAKFVQQLKQKFDHLDLLVNNAGAYLKGELVSVSEAELSTQLNTNLRAVIYLSQQLLPLLTKGTNPQIINISSIAALKPSSEGRKNTIYGAVKAGVTAFSAGLRNEYNPLGIRVSVIHPYGVNTWDDAHPEKLLKTSDLGSLVNYIANTDKNCQIDELTISSLLRD